MASGAVTAAVTAAGVLSVGMGLGVMAKGKSTLEAAGGVFGVAAGGALITASTVIPAAAGAATVAATTITAGVGGAAAAMGGTVAAGASTAALTAGAGATAIVAAPPLAVGAVGASLAGVILGQGAIVRASRAVAHGMQTMVNDAVPSFGEADDVILDWFVR